MAAKKLHRLSKSAAFYVPIGVLIIVALTLLGASVFLRIMDIEVTGASVYSTDDIIKVSGLSVGDNLLFVNTQSVAQRIRQALPFVSTAQVSRILPNIVLIEITESAAIAKIIHAGEVFVVDSAGRVLMQEEGNGPEITDDSGNPIHLIDVRGVDIDNAVIGSIIRPVFGSEMKLQYMQDVLSAFEREEIEKDVSYLDVSNIVNVHFGYLDKFRVILGGSTNLRQSNLRHNLGRLPETVSQIEFRFPNTAGDINMTDANAEPIFTPS